ncbi:putative reverse transcriptase domain-containing protein [Tanacetum coccineum]
MESVFHISDYAIDNQVKFATCTLLGAALTWWNGHVRTLGHDAAYDMTWGTLKKKLTDKYCPKGEIKKLEIELWNFRVRGNDVHFWVNCKTLEKCVTMLVKVGHGVVVTHEVSVIVSLLWIVDSERDRLIVVDRGTRSVPMLPVLWAEIGESSLIEPELVQETTDKVVLIKKKLKAARDRQKSYADNRLKPLEFKVGDRVMLKVSPWKGDIRFGKKGKLAPRYVGPFEIHERIGLVAYRLRFPEELSGVHDTFHVVGCFFSFGAVMLLCVPFCGQAKLLAVRYLVKVSWNSKGDFELTWVWEDYLKDKYPQLIVWLVKPLVLTYEFVAMYGLCIYMRYVDYVRVGNQSIERDHLIVIRLVMDLVKFLSFTFGGKEMTFVVLAFLR